MDLRPGSRVPAKQVIFALILISGLFALAFSAPKAKAQPAAEQRLGDYERIVFGRAQTSGTPVSRLIHLETSVYGTAHPGTIENRQDALNEMLKVPKAKPDRPRVKENAAVAETRQSPAKASADGESKTNIKRGHVVENTTLHVQTDTLMKQGMELYAAGNLAAAESIFRAVTAIDQTCEDAYFNVGTLEEKRGDLKGAVHNYAIAANLDPADMELQSALNSAEQKLESGKVEQNKLTLAPEGTTAINLPDNKGKSSKHFGKAVSQCAQAAAFAGVTIGRNFLHNGRLDIGCPICRLLSF